MNLRDYKECINGDKQKKRAEAIGKQRQKLYKEGNGLTLLFILNSTFNDFIKYNTFSGKLERAFVENHPQPGEFKTDHFDYNRIN